MINIRKLETELWESADLLRQGSKLTSSQYCMPVLALLFLRYAYSRYKMVEAEILQSRPMRGGRVMPVEPSDFAAKSALYLPKEAQCDYVMANPPFNVDKVKAESASAAGRLPFGLPGVNAKTKEVGNANYLWISYFYAYLNDHGRAGFVMASSATDSANKDRDIREKLVRTGDVDVMVSVGNNFFYTLSLPCSLWFFDRNKNTDIRDKVLFIDARNYYTVVDRTLNEWTEWQLRNLQAIVHLYRGETEKYKALIADYDEALQGQTIESLEAAIQKQKAEAKQLIAEAQRKDKKRIEAEQNALVAELEETLEIARQREWLTSKFGDGEYQDILGLCKIATIQEIEEKNYSLTPGAYVGVAEQEDDGVDFHERMNEIHAQLAQLNQEAGVLMDEIQKAWEELKEK
jgi:type I restriction enzyme M protein